MIESDNLPRTFWPVVSILSFSLGSFLTLAVERTHFHIGSGKSMLVYNETMEFVAASTKSNSGIVSESPAPEEREQPTTETNKSIRPKQGIMGVTPTTTNP